MCCYLSFLFLGAEVREVDLKAVTGGIVHTKLWVVDQKHFYLGSANMDWRSLSQVKQREEFAFLNEPWAWLSFTGTKCIVQSKI